MLSKKLITWINTLFLNPAKLDYLRKFPMLADLTNHELYLFSQIVHERKFKQGEIIYREQFPLAVIYLISGGSIEVTDSNEPDSQPVILTRHQFYGVIDMYNEKRRKGKATAQTDATLLAISNVDFQAFINTNPTTGVKLLNNICKSLSHYVFEIQDRK